MDLIKLFPIDIFPIMWRKVKKQQKKTQSRTSLERFDEDYDPTEQKRASSKVRQLSDKTYEGDMMDIADKTVNW